MSMLAARKKKQKFIVQPKGAPSTLDGDNFGRRLMEKMGWSTGKGLGADESGTKDPIRVRYKNDTSGVGFSEKFECDKSSEFSALLELLQKADDGTIVKPMKTESLEEQPQNGSNVKPTIASLEEKSQKSRARLHYKKFTRGKDLSRYSDKDLANIFGKKRLHDTADIANNPTDSLNNPENTEPNASGDGGVLKNCGSMSDYFKQKLSAKGHKLNQIGGIVSYNAVAPLDESNSFKSVGFVNPTFDLNAEAQDDTSNVQVEVKKKKKQKKGVDEYMKATINNGMVDNDFEVKRTEVIESNINNKLFKRKKKKKQKIVDAAARELNETNDLGRNENVIEHFDATYENVCFNDNDGFKNTNGTVDNNTNKVKKKKKQYKGVAKQTSDTTVYENDCFNCVDDDGTENDNSTVDFEVKRKERRTKKRKSHDCFVNSALNISDNSSCTPSKRKKSVRFSNVNQEHIIPNNLQLNELYAAGEDLSTVDNGFINGAFDLRKANLEENIVTMAETIDRYQAEVENDMNEARVVTKRASALDFF